MFKRCVLLGWILGFWGGLFAEEDLSRQVSKMLDDGHYAELVKYCDDVLFHQRDVVQRMNSESVQHVLTAYLEALENLSRTPKTDAFLEKVVAAYRDQWRVLEAVSTVYATRVNHRGQVIAGEFRRGQRRGSGQFASCLERDRVRSLQLLLECRPLVEKDSDKIAAGKFYLKLADVVLCLRNDSQTAWELQDLTDVETLPDYDTENPWGRQDSSQGAPVDEAGNPVMYGIPESWESAKNDGERWRWCLAQAAVVSRGAKIGDFDVSTAFAAEADFHLAHFLMRQYGTQTLAGYGFSTNDDDATEKTRRQGGIRTLETLPDEETIADLATGVKRFALPDDYNPLKLFQKLAATPNPRQAESLSLLGNIYLNRRQYVRAAESLKTLLDLHERNAWFQVPTEFGVSFVFNDTYRERYQQIVGNWGRFESQPMKTTENMTIGFRFRNAKKVTFRATRVDVDKLYAAMKRQIEEAVAKSPYSPKERNSDWNNRLLQWEGNLPYALVEGAMQKFLTNEVQEWSVDLEPAAQHKDATQRFEIPFREAGAYYIVSQVEGGNRAATLVWFTDTMIVRKSMDDRNLYYVADAATGKEIAGAQIFGVGYRQHWFNEGNNRQHPKVRFTKIDLLAKTDANGLWRATNKEMPQHMEWFLGVKRPGSERISGFLGFHVNRVWYNTRIDEIYDQTKAFPVTDRPVYRPGQTVRYKFWCAQAKYENEQNPEGNDGFVADRTVTLSLHDPQGEELQKIKVKTDAYGAVSGEYTLPKDAKLGQYQISLEWDVMDRSRESGQVRFRVEEYKKPEFEVTVDAPTEPVRLGDKVKAVVNAKYYFGSPVTSGKANVRIVRKSYTQRWFAPARWDWLLGPGYWWFASEYAWYPGWNDWGCLPPVPEWFDRSYEHPEMVLEKEIDLTEAMAGKIEVEFDTFLAAAIHPNQDHEYTITVDVTDASRRRISGTGKVQVARRPFQVYAWTDRGYYTVGNEIAAQFTARTLAGKPVTGDGVVKVFEVSYDAQGEPVEKEIVSEKVATNGVGEVVYRLKATHAGQFRVALTLSDAKGRSVEGAQLIMVTGDGFDGKALRFNDLEILPDKPEYRPGDTMKLLVSANRADCTVLLFVRCVNGCCTEPKVLHMTGKSQVFDVPISIADQPNLFIEALTVANAQVYTQTKEICVPPEKRILTMEILPEKTAFLPGEKAKAKIRLTDQNGEPFVGDTVVTVYDKSLEYISGGSNLPDIYTYFWGWKRRHHPDTQSNTNLISGSLVFPGERGMTHLGVFGYLTERKEKNDMRGSLLMGGSSQRKSENVMAAAAPLMMAAAPMAPESVMEEALDDAVPAVEVDEKPGDAAKPVEPTVRSHFADTAFWAASVKTDSNGYAEIEIPMPENLTTWKIMAWGLGRGARVGKAEAEIVTRKNLLIRMQTPRFLTTSDEITLTANVHNYLKTAKDVTVSIRLPEGSPITLLDDAQQDVTIPADGQARVDWRVRANDEGSCVVQMAALTDEESDAMELSFPVQIHGMTKQLAQSVMLPANAASGAETTMTFVIPEARRPKDSRLEIRFSPTLAGAMLDAIPYLADYPYGCTEQTLNRFLPTVLVQRTLGKLGMNLEEVAGKLANLNAQEIGDAADRKKQWETIRSPYARAPFTPVFDSEELTKRVNEGAGRLVNMQCSDGGWGWFSGFGEYSTPYLTAYVTRGLLLAQQNEMPIPGDCVQRGIAWLKRYQAKELARLARGKAEKPVGDFKYLADDTDAFVFYALAQAGVLDNATQKMSDYLFRDHGKLSHQSNALLGIAWFQRGEEKKLAEAIVYLTQFLKIDEENQTAYLELPANGFWWFWYGNEIETQAAYLKLLSLTHDREGHAQKAAYLVKYLLNNRKNATYWCSTRDTALVLEAMTEYLRATGELAPEMTVEVLLDGNVVKTVAFTKENLFTSDNTFTLSGEEVTGGEHVVTLRRTGSGPLFANGYATFFTLEDFITKTGLEVKVERKYYKLVRDENATETRAGSRGQVVKEKVEKYTRVPLKSGAVVTSGDLIEVELFIQTKNDYTFLMFEDMKPAGFETVDVRSGYNGNPMGAYVEFRDNRVVFFVKHLERGDHSVSYRMRAEMPGVVSALPTRCEAMYAPELRANSDEMKIGCQDERRVPYGD
ncbi:MAG: MG2 domain-containing protein [Planctomycetia bacterium]|nr:MG2 domain-containing protein [Planctomycetia bacterium]